MNGKILAKRVFPKSPLAERGQFASPGFSNWRSAMLVLRRVWSSQHGRKAHKQTRHRPVKPRFEVVAECRSTRARAGILHTPHGPVETPVFMPVGTQATVKGLTPSQLADDLDARMVLANTYHLWLRPGEETIRECGGLHRYMRWPRGILTDSGGYQVFSMAALRRITEEGVHFRSHLDGSQRFLGPERAVDIQRALGSDVMMVLDDCTAYPVSESEARESMERTLRWAARSFDHWRRSGSDAGAMLFPIVQGSMFAGLRRECASRLVELDAPGYAVGGLSVGEPRPLSYEMAAACGEVLPRERPRYVMGVGMPHEIGEYVALGIDMMDCVLPTRNARNGTLFTDRGKLMIKNAVHARDSAPIDETCGCYTCRNFSRSYLRHLLLAREMLFGTLATIHNLWLYLDRMRRIREAILTDSLPALLRGMSAGGAVSG